VTTNQILRAVKKIGDPLMEHIHEEVGGDYDALRAQVQELVRNGYLRMKDDDIDHDWSYRLTDAGRRLLL